MKGPLIISFFFLSTTLLAQEAEREKIRELQQQKELEQERLVRIQLDSGIYFLEREEYELADARFRYALSNMKSIPSDLAYYFGKNSYYLKKYKQSIDWLTKYLQLKGTTGQFSTEGAGWLKKAEEGLLQERQTETLKANEVLSRDYNIDCGPSGKVMCPVCSGSTVIIRKDYVQGEIYKTCPYCNKHGYLTCEEYNKLIRGQLKPASANK